MAESTGRKQRGIGRPFAPGVSGNPRGRPVGAKAVFSQDFIKDVHAAWLEHGSSALRACAVTEPGRFLQVCASLMPREASLSVDVDLKSEVALVLADFRNLGIPDRNIQKIMGKILPTQAIDAAE
jgi:hypothetical protein